MKTKPINPNSKRQQGVDRHLLPRKVYHAPTSLFAALAKFASENGMHESEVNRIAMTEFLRARGYYEPSVN